VIQERESSFLAWVPMKWHLSHMFSRWIGVQRYRNLI
jgi:hypothetical protein